MITMHMYAHEITYIQNTLRLSQCMCYFPSYRSNQELWAILPNYRVLYRTLSRGRLPFSLHFALCKLVSDGFLSVANLRLWQWFTPRLFLLKEHPPAIIHFPKLVNQQWQWTWSYLTFQWKACFTFVERTTCINFSCKTPGWLPKSHHPSRNLHTWVDQADGCCWTSWRFFFIHGKLAASSQLNEL